MTINNLNKILPILYFFIISIIFINRIYFLDLKYTSNNLSLFLSISFIGFCFLTFHLFLRENQNNFPFIVLIVLYLFITYGFSYELIGDFLSVKNEDIIIKTFIILNLAIIFLNLGYFSIKKLFNKKRSGLNFLEVKNYKVLILISLFFLTINFFDKFYNFIPSNLNQIKVPIITISCSFIFYSVIKFKDIKNYIYIFLIFVTIFFELLTSSYVFPASLILVYFVIYFIVNKKIPIFLILFFITFFFTLHLFKGEFRLNLNFANIDPVERSKLFMKFYSTILISDTNQYIVLEKKKELPDYIKTEPNRTKTNNWRLAHSFSSLIILVEKTPSSINYLNGETYKHLKTKFVPRIIWPDKPSDTIANYIGRKYGVLGINDNSTSWNLPIINEAYINFGVPGVIFMSFILGIIVRIFTEIFSINNFNNAESHIGVYLCCSTFFWEPHLSLVYGGIYYPIIFLYFLMTILIYFLNRFVK